MSADSPASILFNTDGYAVGVIEDGYVYRLQVESSIKPGSSILSSPTPSDIQLLIANKLKNTGSENLLVNGSVTPKTFKYEADSLKDIKLSELRIVLVANSIHFIGTNFGAISTLTNGVKIEVKSNGTVTTLATLKVNEDFLLFHSTNSIFMNEAGSKDVIAVGYLLGGAVVLKAGTDDYLGIVIQDNLTQSSFAYFQATGYGIKDA